MIELILKMLEITRLRTDEINILKGRDKIPQTIKEGFRQRKMKSQ